MSRLAVPDRLDERAGLRHPTSRPPSMYAASSSDSGGPTCDCDLAPLCRFHPRLKTHGRWLFTRLDETTVLRRSPHGLSFLRDHTGTRDFTDTQAPSPPDA